MLGSALCGLAPSVDALVGARVVQAVGAALLLPTSLALLLPEFEPEERPQAIGIWAADRRPRRRGRPAHRRAARRAQLAARVPRQRPDRLVAIAYGVRLLRESRDEAQERPDLLGSALIIVAVGVLALGLVEGARSGAGAIPARSRRSPSPRPAWRPSGRAA